MDKLNKRIKTYSQLSTQLSRFSDVQLVNLLSKAEPLSHFGRVSGKSFLLNIDNAQIFVKKIPLTDIERQPENVMSTANLFEMPFSSHIGVGGAGISSWRELFVHSMTTNWVISGECQNFPLMYHWRILPTAQPQHMNATELAELEQKVKYWDNSPAEHKRFDAMHHASADIYLFIEYVPQTLFKWLGNKLAAGGIVAEEAIASIDEKLKVTNEFMNSRGLLHFDVHFWNILIDEETIYVTDFGLSLYDKFDMSDDEKAQFAEYHTYDRCVSVTNLLMCIIGCIFDKDPWEIKISDYLGDRLDDLELAVVNIIKRYSAVAVLTNEFFDNMRTVSKSTPYPAKQLEHLFTEIDTIRDEKTFAICPATNEDMDHIHNKIIEFNKANVPFTQSEEPIYKNYIIKDDGKIVAGINAMIYHWGILYVDVLFVDDNYRGRNFGTDLLNKVESEAKNMAAKLAHLDTFDFQAKDFYIKNGYKVFGVLENCPAGHKRYYFSKSL